MKLQPTGMFDNSSKAYDHITVTPLASAIWPALTTIRQPIRDMSREAIGLLAMRFRSQDEGSAGSIAAVKLDYQLIRRQSDAVPARH